MPIHKRIAKEKLRVSYDINEILDHVYDLFQHVGKELAPVNYQSVTRGCQKTIQKFSKKLKEMIKVKGDFYLPKSRSRSRNASRGGKRDSEAIGVYESKDIDMKPFASNEITINPRNEESKTMAA